MICMLKRTVPILLAVLAFALSAAEHDPLPHRRAGHGAHPLYAPPFRRLLAQLHAGVSRLHDCERDGERLRRQGRGGAEVRQAARGNAPRLHPADGAAPLELFGGSAFFRPGRAEVHRSYGHAADRGVLRPRTAGRRQAGGAAERVCRQSQRFHFFRTGFHAGDSDHGADHHSARQIRSCAAGRPRLQNRPLCGAHRIHAVERLHPRKLAEAGDRREAVHLHHAESPFRGQHGLRRRQGGGPGGRLDRSGGGKRSADAPGRQTALAGGGVRHHRPGPEPGEILHRALRAVARLFPEERLGGAERRARQLPLPASRAGLAVEPEGDRHGQGVLPRRKQHDDSGHRQRRRRQLVDSGAASQRRAGLDRGEPQCLRRAVPFGLPD